MAEAEWFLAGQFLELCTCEIACPCVMDGSDARPSLGHCDGGFAWHAEDGAFGGTTLGDVSFAFLHHAPGRMSEGNWTSAIYIDERAGANQRTALEQILSGRHGGPLQAYMALTGKFLGIRYVPIDYNQSGHVHSVTIPDVLDFQVEALTKPGFDEPNRLEGFRRWVPWMSVSRGIQGTYRDHELRFDNRGRNGFCGPFRWPQA